jgi:hypothetical protein
VDSTALASHSAVCSVAPVAARPPGPVTRAPEGLGRPRGTDQRPRGASGQLGCQVPPHLGQAGGPTRRGPRAASARSPAGRRTRPAHAPSSPTRRTAPDTPSSRQRPLGRGAVEQPPPALATHPARDDAGRRGLRRPTGGGERRDGRQVVLLPPRRAGGPAQRRDVGRRLGLSSAARGVTWFATATSGLSPAWTSAATAPDHLRHGSPVPRAWTPWIGASARRLPGCGSRPAHPRAVRTARELSRRPDGQRQLSLTCSGWSQCHGRDCCRYVRSRRRSLLSRGMSSQIRRIAAARGGSGQTHTVGNLG